MKQRQRHGLKGRMARILVVMFLLLTLFFLIVIRTVSTAEIRRFALTEIEAQHRQVGDGIVMILDEINLLYARMVLHDDFLLVLEDRSLTHTDKEQVFRRMMERVGVNETLFGDIIVYFNDDFYRMDGTVHSSMPDPAFLNRVVTSHRSIEQGDVARDRDGEAYLMFGKRMVNFPTGHVTGALIFLVRESALQSVTSVVSQGRGYSLVVADGHEIITHTQRDVAGHILFDAPTYGLGPDLSAQTRELDGRRVMVIPHKLESLSQRYHLDWAVVSVIDHDALFGNIARLDRTIIALGVVLVAAAALLSVGLSTRITRPIDRIVQRLRRFTATGKKEPAPGVIRDELWELETTYDEMIDRISDLIRTNQEKAEIQRQLELDALQMQINPHFLYNTLDAIAWMAKLKKQPEIANLAIALARFFRISLHHGDKFITVAQEIELIRNFVAIELIRFPDKFDMGISVDPDIENEMTLKLILQPIVENAIKHGVSLLEERGRINIKAYGDGEYVRFEISDDGVGFDPSESLLSKGPGERQKGGGERPKGPDEHRSGGYGLRNVNERIKLEYGPDCGVDIQSQVGGGTQVTVTIKRSSTASLSAVGSAVS